MAEPTDLEILEGRAPEPPAFECLSSSWLVATGQDRQLRLMMLLSLTGAGLAVLRWIGAWPALHIPPAVLGWTGGMAAMLVCGGLLFALLSIRCRACGCRVALHFVRHANFTRWTYELQAARACPRCGHHPGTGAQ